MNVLSEEESGVPDSELVDFMIFEQKSPNGRPILAVKFCPWCGQKKADNGTLRVSEFEIQDSETDEDWRGESEDA